MSRLLRAAALVALPSLAGAQRLQPELRADVLGPAPASLQPGVGVNAAAGTYARIGLAAGYDVTGRDAGRRFRADVVARVTLDPFREQRTALAVGGGLTMRGSRLYLAALIELEGPETGGWVPALQTGVSGGLRAGLILRRAIPGRR